MKILVLGGDGMLGHALLASLAPSHEVKVTLRRPLGAYAMHGLFSDANAYGGIEAASLDSVQRAADDFGPGVIVNAIGIVKQRATARESIPSLEVNALLPHRLALLARGAGARLVHFSTDCVFSGRKGNYSENDVPDPEDLYGQTKLLGEVEETQCLTLRTSLIGRELARRQNLVEWFLAQKGTVRGFRKAIFSGFTTLELARIVEMLVSRHQDAHGIWHVSSEAIDKCSLLELLKKHYGLDTEIVPDDRFRCDRSLDSSRFRAAFGYQPPSWEAMIAEMSGSGGACG